jgi:hypothetical protein
MAKKKAKDEASTQESQHEAFENHLRGYLGFLGFFFVINLVTSPGRWWFYWPVMVWGAFLVMHAFGTYGPYAPVAVVNIIRNWFTSYKDQVPPVVSAPQPPKPAPAAASASSGQPSYTASEAEARIARLWRTARTIQSPSTQDRAFRVCAAADRVAEALAMDNADPQFVTWYVERYLEPLETLLAQYARLERRGVDGAEEALAKVENENLPMLESKLDTLYQQLHRGDLVSLQVASEMLEFGLSDPPPRLSRTSSR